MWEQIFKIQIWWVTGLGRALVESCSRRKLWVIEQLLRKASVSLPSHSTPSPKWDKLLNHSHVLPYFPQGQGQMGEVVPPTNGACTACRVEQVPSGELDWLPWEGDLRQRSNLAWWQWSCMELWNDRQRGMLSCLWYLYCNMVPNTNWFWKACLSKFTFYFYNWKFETWWKEKHIETLKMIFLFNLEPSAVLMKSTRQLETVLYNRVMNRHTDIVLTPCPSKGLAIFLKFFSKRWKVALLCCIAEPT